MISWNVADLDITVKRKKILTHLKRPNPDLVFLHIIPWVKGRHLASSAPWIDYCVEACDSAKSRGAVIFYRKYCHILYFSILFYIILYILFYTNIHADWGGGGVSLC